MQTRPAQLSKLAKGKAVCVAADHEAAEVGALMLRRGGNAFDAAAAAGFFEAVISPANCGIGGYGASGVGYLAARRETIAIDANSVAPAAARPDLFPVIPTRDPNGYKLPNDRHRRGPLSVGVPGVLGGLCLLAEKYGKLGLKAVMEPAIERAGSGVSLTPGQALTWLTMKAAAEGQPLPERAALPKKVVMEDLAATLRSIADQGPTVFYEGRIGRAIAEHVQHLGGILTEKDMAAYRAEVVPAISVQVGEHRLIGPPPASGSLTSMQMVALFARLAERPIDDLAVYHHWLAEVAKVCWEHRLTTLCDHRFMKPGPQTCLSDEELASLLGRVRLGVKKPERGRVVAPDPLRGTVHLAAADGEGNVISWTQTHGGGFGSGVMVKGTGVVLGHGMCRFEPRPGWANSIAPGKRPLHNMCPVIVLRDGEAVCAAGAAGGRTIVNNVAALLIHRFVLGRDTAASVSLSRSQIETMEPVTIERSSGPDVLARLKELGHELKEVSRDAGTAHLVTRAGEGWEAAAESRSASAGVALA